MNVFEDLVEELKDENLLEETVINTISAEEQRKKEEIERAQADAETAEFSEEQATEPLSSTETDTEAANVESADAVPENGETSEFAFAETAEATVPEQENFTATNEHAAFTMPKSPVSEMEYYRRRAMEEVTSLQLVEHVFSGVERDQVRISPKPFDDIAVKKALHDFLQVSREVNSGDSAQAEFKLMQETESWCSALSYRDKNISVSDLRRYCETTKPVLSSQALLALARFYRNLPHTEAVRSKFDMVLTRLFAVDANRNRRELTASREEMIKKISDNYADWASVPLYSESDETDLLLTTVKFDDFMAEAQGADSFDELVKNDFYNRLRLFKESIGDKFYAPMVLASAVECNVHIGNRYVELLEKEREQSSAEAIQVKYGFLLDQSISDASGKTLQLSDLLTEKKEEKVQKSAEPKETLNLSTSAAKQKGKKKAKAAGGLFGISKALIAALVGVVVLTIGLYVYVEYGSTTQIPADVQKVNLDNSSYKDYLSSARISQDILIGIVTDSWSNTGEDKRQEILGKLLNAGKEKGFKKVHLLNREGVTVGYASEKEIVVSGTPQL